jgi:hypothetical protein
LGQEIELRRASKGLGNPLEASYWHLPKTPFHMTLQKVTGLVIGLTRTMEETTIRKYFQFHGKSRGILSEEYCLPFRSEVAGFRLEGRTKKGDYRFFPCLIQECPLDQDLCPELEISLC